MRHLIFLTLIGTLSACGSNGSVLNQEAHKSENKITVVQVDVLETKFSKDTDQNIIDHSGFLYLTLTTDGKAQAYHTSELYHPYRPSLLGNNHFEVDHYKPGFLLRFKKEDNEDISNLIKSFSLMFPSTEQPKLQANIGILPGNYYLSGREQLQVNLNSCFENLDTTHVISCVIPIKTKNGGGTGAIELKFKMTKQYLKQAHKENLDLVRAMLKSPELKNPDLPKVFEAPAYCATDLVECQKRTADLFVGAELLVAKMVKNGNPLAAKTKQLFNDLKPELQTSKLGLRQRTTDYIFFDDKYEIDYLTTRLPLLEEK